MNIAKRIAIVTGAASGLGKAVSEVLDERGATVLRVDHRWPDLLNDSCWEIDVTNAERRHTFFNDVCRVIGSPTIVVPCAGIALNGRAVQKDNSLYPMEDWQRQIDVNLTAACYWMLEMFGRAAERFGVSEDPGTVAVGVAIGSVIRHGAGGQFAYAATKAAWDGIIPSLNADGRKFGCRFGVVHPGFCKTPMVESLGEEYLAKHILPQTANGKLIPPEELAEVICRMIESDCRPEVVEYGNGWHG